MKLKNLIQDVKNVRGIVNIIFFYKNWYIRFLEYFGTLKGVVNYELRNGLKFNLEVVPGKSDTHILEDIFIAKPYTKDGFEIKDGNVVDIGANKGVFTVLAAFKKKTMVFSYEPDEKNFLFLKKNISQNKLRNVKAFMYAVSNKNGKIPFFAFGHGVGTTVKTTSKFKPTMIQSIMLSDIFNNNKISSIDFLKMDCEGAEYQILFSTPDKYLRRIRRISMEFHDSIKYKPEDLIKFLQKKGFETKLISGMRIIHAHRVEN